MSRLWLLLAYVAGVLTVLLWLGLFWSFGEMISAGR